MHGVFHARRPTDGRRRARGFQFARRRIDGEQNETVRLLIGHDHEFSTGRNVEVAWRVALNALDLDEREESRRAIDREDSDGIVTPVGRVEELAGAGREQKFGTRVRQGVTRWQGGHGLHGCQPRKVTVDCDRRSQFVEHVDEFIVGAEDQMSGSIAWPGNRVDKRARDRPVGSREPILIDLIGAEIRTESVLLLVVEQNAVRMRRALPIGIDR